MANWMDNFVGWRNVNEEPPYRLSDTPLILFFGTCKQEEKAQTLNICAIARHLLLILLCRRSSRAPPPRFLSEWTRLGGKWFTVPMMTNGYSWRRILGGVNQVKCSLSFFGAQVQTTRMFPLHQRTSVRGRTPMDYGGGVCKISNKIHCHSRYFNASRSLWIIEKTKHTAAAAALCFSANSEVIAETSTFHPSHADQSL